MSRAMWKGAISFGLVSVPVKVYSATEEKSLSFHQIDSKNNERIRYKRVGAKSGREVPYERIVRGYEFEKDSYVVLTDEELDAVPAPSTHTIEVAQFTDQSEIDPIYFERSYYLVPDETGRKPYHLLRQSMEDAKKIAIGKVAFREKEHLASIRPRDEMLVLDTMRWPNEIRDPSFDELESKPRSSEKELKMAKSLIGSMSSKWRPEDFKDEYREALLKVIQKKIAGEEVEQIEAPDEAPVVNLMEALEASLKAAEKPKSRKRAS